MADRPGHEELQAFLKSTFHILSKNRKVNSPSASTLCSLPVSRSTHKCSPAATAGPTNLAGYAKCTLCGTDDIINSRGAKLRHLAHPRCQRQERLPEWVDKLAQEMQEKRRRDNARSMRRKRTAAKAAEDSSQIMNNAAAEHVRLPSVSTPTFPCTHLYGFPVTARILSTLQSTTHFSRSAFC